jgi:stage III sporulation protein AB
MIKFFLGVAIVAFMTFCGYLLAKKYRKRMLFIQEFYTFNERFLSEIAYYRRPIKEFIALYAYQGEFNDFLIDVLSEREENAQISFVKPDVYPFLTEEDRKTVDDYFFMLGKGDSASQKGYFSSIKERLSSLKKEAELEAKRYGDLYIKLGFLCGLLILILIV